MDLLLNCFNVFVFLFIVVGAAVHHNRLLHVKLMKIAFVLDLALLLAVELNGSAVATAMRSISDQAADHRVLTWIHVCFAASGLLLWFVQLIVGSKILKGRMELLPRHALCAKIFLFVRLGNVVTAWMF